MKDTKQILESYKNQFQAPSKEDITAKCESNAKALVEQLTGVESIVCHTAVSQEEMIKEINTRVNDTHGIRFKVVRLEKNKTLNPLEWHTLLFKLFELGYVLHDKHKYHSNNVCTLLRPDQYLEANPTLVAQHAEKLFVHQYDAAVKAYFDKEKVMQHVEAEQEAERQRQLAALKAEQEKGIEEVLADLQVEQQVQKALDKLAKDEFAAKEIGDLLPDLGTQKIASILKKLGYTSTRKASGNVWTS